MTVNPHVVNVQITFKNTAATEAIKKYTEDKITACLRKFVHADTEAHIVLSVEKSRQIAEISVHSGSTEVNCKEESTDLYASIDALVDLLTNQLRKNKEKMVKHH